ncbi:MAG: hypothetical protein ACK2U9_16660, partial [Anaerolineae bacterium]
MLGNVSSTRRRSRTHLRTSHSRRGPGRRWLALAALAALVLSVISAGPSARPTLAATTGAPIV